MVKTPKESDKLIYAETNFAMFVAEVATNPKLTQISVFFSLDPDTVLLEYADPDLNLARLPQIIWGQNQHYILRRPYYFYLNFFGLHPNFGRKNVPILSEELFLSTVLLVFAIKINV